MVRLLVIATLLAAGCGGSKDDAAGNSKKAVATTTTTTDATTKTKAPAPKKGDVDCGKVAKHLTLLSKQDIARAGVGPDQQPAAAKTVAALETTVIATCERLWNDDTRTCLLAAKNEVDIKRCKKYQVVGKAPQPALPSGDQTAALPTCDAVINHFLALATREVAANPAIPAAAKGMAMGKVGKLGGLLVPMCMRGWPGKLKTCVLAAKTVFELEPCRKYMPKSLKALEESVTP